MKELLLSFNTILATIVPMDIRPEEHNTSQIIAPLSGVWQLELPNKINKNCKETYHFGADNKLSVVSGKEWTEGSFTFFPTKDGKLPVLLLTTKVDDNNVDCSGSKVDQSGESYATFYKRVDRNKFELCTDPKGNKCFLTFYQILP